MANKNDTLASMREALKNKKVKAFGMTPKQIEDLREEYQAVKVQLETAQSIMDGMRPMVDMLKMVGIDLDAEPDDGPHDVTDIREVDLANMAGLDDLLK